MSRELISRSVQGAVLGLAYGGLLLFLLCVLGVDGAPPPLYLSCSPVFPLLHDLSVIPAALIFWMITGFLVTDCGRWSRRIGFPTFIVAHYAVGIVYMLAQDFYAWQKLRQVLENNVTFCFFAVWLAIYIGGQVVLWRAYLHPAGLRKTPKAPPES